LQHGGNGMQHAARLDLSLRSDHERRSFCACAANRNPKDTALSAAGLPLRDRAMPSVAQCHALSGPVPAAGLPLRDRAGVRRVSEPIRFGAKNARRWHAACAGCTLILDFASMDAA
jgi:hypothetical protein